MVPLIVAILGPGLVKVSVLGEDLGAGQEHETHQLQSQHPRHLFGRSMAGKRGNEFPRVASLGLSALGTQETHGNVGGKGRRNVQGPK